MGNLEPCPLPQRSSAHNTPSSLSPFSDLVGVCLRLLIYKPCLLLLGMSQRDKTEFMGTNYKFLSVQPKLRSDDNAPYLDYLQIGSDQIPRERFRSAQSLICNVKRCGFVATVTWSDSDPPSTPSDDSWPRNSDNQENQTLLFFGSQSHLSYGQRLCWTGAPLSGNY